MDSTVHHLGNTSSAGHYTAYTRVEGLEWCFNDTSATTVGVDHAMSEQIYLVSYQAILSALWWDGCLRHLPGPNADGIHPTKEHSRSLRVRDEVHLCGQGLVHADGGGTGVVETTPLMSLYTGTRRVVARG